MNLIIGISSKWSARAWATHEGLPVKIEDENCLLWELIPTTKNAYSQKDLKITALFIKGYLRIIKTPFVYQYIGSLVEYQKKLLEQLEALKSLAHE